MNRTRSKTDQRKNLQQKTCCLIECCLLKSFFKLAAPPFGKGVGCEALSIITDSQDFPKLWTQLNQFHESEVHSTALCKRITNCNFSCDVVAAPDTNGQSGSQFFSHATLVETIFATQGGEKCCWHAIFTKINKSVETKKKL